MQRICTAARKRCCSFCVSRSSNASPTFSGAKRHFPPDDEADTSNGHTPLLLAISFSRNDDIHSSISGISNNLIGVLYPRSAVMFPPIFHQSSEYFFAISSGTLMISTRGMAYHFTHHGQGGILVLSPLLYSSCLITATAPAACGCTNNILASIINPFQIGLINRSSSFPRSLVTPLRNR